MGTPGLGRSGLRAAAAGQQADQGQAGQQQAGGQQEARFTQNNRLVSNGFSTTYSTPLDTRYTVETRGDVKLAAMPAGFEDRFHVQRLFAERNGGVWYAYKDTVPAEPSWTIRLNGSATTALRAALGIE